MQHSEAARPQVLYSPMWIEQLGAIGDGIRHRVHGEVAAGEVLSDRSRPDLRQGARLRIALGSRLRHVDLPPIGLELAGEEVLVALGPVARNVSERLRVPLDRDVEIAALHPEQEVPDHSAHQIGRNPLGEPAGRVDARQRVDRPWQSGRIYFS